MNKPTCKLKATSRPSRFVPRTTVCGDRLGLRHRLLLCDKSAANGEGV